MTKHTKEPWKTVQDDLIKSTWFIETESDAPVLIAFLTTGNSGPGTPVDNEANARHIVTCVNACKGHATALLESVADKKFNRKLVVQGSLDGKPMTIFPEEEK